MPYAGRHPLPPHLGGLSPVVKSYVAEAEAVGGWVWVMLITWLWCRVTLPTYTHYRDINKPLLSNCIHACMCVHTALRCTQLIWRTWLLDRSFSRWWPQERVWWTLRWTGWIWVKCFEWEWGMLRFALALCPRTSQKRANILTLLCSTLFYFKVLLLPIWVCFSLRMIFLVWLCVLTVVRTHSYVY